MRDEDIAGLMSEAELKEILGGMVSVRLRDGSFRDVGDKLRAHIDALEAKLAETRTYASKCQK